MDKVHDRRVLHVYKDNLVVQQVGVLQGCDYVIVDSHPFGMVEGGPCRRRYRVNKIPEFVHYKNALVWLVFFASKFDSLRTAHIEEKGPVCTISR